MDTEFTGLGSLESLSDLVQSLVGPHPCVVFLRGVRAPVPHRLADRLDADTVVLCDLNTEPFVGESPGLGPNASPEFLAPLPHRVILSREEGFDKRLFESVAGCRTVSHVDGNRQPEDTGETEYDGNSFHYEEAGKIVITSRFQNGASPLTRPRVSSSALELMI